MPDRSPSICRYGILVAAFIAATSGIASVGRSQQVSGSIGASLTILAPIAVPQLRITSIGVGRDGAALIETSLPAPGRMSQLVMVRVSSPAHDSAPQPRPPTASTLFVPSSAVTRAQHVGTLRRDGGVDGARPATLRVECLIVAGT